jgi:hypothetical protein
VRRGEGRQVVRKQTGETFVTLPARKRDGHVAFIVMVATMLLSASTSKIHPARPVAPTSIVMIAAANGIAA